MKKLKFQTYIIASSLASLLLTAGALGVVFLNVKNIIDNQKHVSDSHELVARINRLSGYMVDMESGERGFLISGDQAYLEPYNIAEAAFDEFLKQSLPFVKSDKDQLGRMDNILKLKNQWIEDAAIGEMMMKRKAGAGKVSASDFVKFFKDSQGKTLTDAVRAEVNATLEHENKKLELLRTENIRLAKNIHSGALVVIFTMLFGFGLIVWTTGIVSKVEKSIRAANRTIEAMLNAMKLAVFAVGKDGAVLDPVSRYSGNIFRSDIAGKNIFDCLYKDINKNSEQYSFAQTAMCVTFGESEVQWSLQEDNLPTEIRYKSGGEAADLRTLRVSYSPIWDDQKSLDKILFVVDDVTDVLRLKKDAEEAKVEIAENNQIINELSDLEFEVVEEFLSKIGTILRKWDRVSQASEVKVEALAEIFREMHTLKGNARVYRMSLIATQIHEVELSLTQLRDRVSKNAFGSEESALLSGGIGGIRQKVSKYSRIAHKIYKIADEIQRDVTADLHRTAWEQQAAFARLRGTIQLGRDIPGFSHKFNEAVKMSWRPLVKLRLTVNSLPDKSLFETVEKLERGLTALGDAKPSDVGVFESNLLITQQEFFRETSKYLLNSQFTRPMIMTPETWAPVFEMVFQLNSVSPSNCQDILLKAKAYCAAHEFDYLERLFGSLLERVSVLDLGSVASGAMHAWNYLSLISALDVARDFSKAQRLELEQLLSAYITDEKQGAAFTGEKFSLPSILTQALLELSKKGVGPKEFFGAFVKFHGDLKTALHLFVGDPTSDFDPAKMQECFATTGSLKEVQGRIQQVPLMVLAFAKVVNEALGRDEAAMPHYLLTYDLVRVLRTFKAVASNDFEILSLPKLIQISEMNLDKLRKTVKDSNLNGHSDIKNISRQVDRILEMPVSTIAVRFAPMIHELSANLKKDVHFSTKGLETTINRELLYSLQEILLHLFRNSLDHGIETPEERLKHGKDRRATINLEVSRKESEKLMVVVSDDGRGIDLAKVRKKAIEKGVVTENQLREMPDQDLLQLIFLPGFSTAEAVTQVSGIGIGMEVVKKTIEDNRGILKIKNSVGKGLEISIEFPA